MANVTIFNAKEIRTDVSNQLAKMSEAKYVNLPDNYKETVFFALDAMSSLPMIEHADQGSITKAFLNMFKNKLDYTKNHCYFFVQNDGSSKTGKSLRFGWQYQGLISVAKSECGVLDVRPVLINADDEFESHYEFGVLVVDKHIPSFSGDIIAGYCVIEYQNKSYKTKYYTKQELDKRRSSSKAPQGNFWKWENEMYEKTLINAALKREIETSPYTSADGLYDEPVAQEQRAPIHVDAIENQEEPTEGAQQESEQDKLNLKDL